MRVALIGGLDRLERRYIEEARTCGVNLKVFNRFQVQLASKIGNADALILFTNKISHTARREAMSTAMSRNIPVRMVHSCGICTLRNCLDCLKNDAREG